MSFWVSPVYNIPVFRAGWTVDNANVRIVGDSSYFVSEDSADAEWTLTWIPDLLQIQSFSNNINYLIPLNGMPLEIQEYDRVDSPFFYLELLFNQSFDITIGGAIGPLNIYLSDNGSSNIYVDYSMNVTSSAGPSYPLPEIPYLGIDGNDPSEFLNGSFQIVDFDITANHKFVTGQATCVFSNTDPAGLLYMVYYHSNGLISLIYAHEVTRTGVLNYFPDGHYEYIWSVFRKD